MQKIFHLEKEKKKRLLRLLLGLKADETEIPRGATAALALAIRKDPSTVWRWPRSGEAWPPSGTEKQLWEYFGLVGNEDPEEVERMIVTQQVVIRDAPLTDDPDLTPEELESELMRVIRLGKRVYRTEDPNAWTLRIIKKLVESQ